MDLNPKEPIGRIGHSITSFVIFDQNLKDKGFQAERDVLSSDGDDASKDMTSDLNIDGKDELQSPDDFGEYDLSYYKESAKLQNKIRKNNVANSRILANIHIDETRRVLHGTWDPDQSESMWLDINGPERDEDSVFTDIQVVRIEDLLHCRKRIEVLLSTKHIYEYVKYDVEAKNAERGSMAGFEYNEKLILMFGGAFPSSTKILDSNPNILLLSIIESDLSLEVTNDLFVSRAKCYGNEWKSLESHNPPSPRAFHASCIIYATLDTPIFVVHGGFGERRELLPSNLYILNLNSKRGLIWDEFATNEPLPPRRYGHSITQVESFLIIFGGTNGERLFNDVWALNINDGIYDKPGKLTANTWSKIEFDGLRPAPRAFHSCTRLGISSNSPMIIYGGKIEHDNVRSRIYALHVVEDERIIWSILPVYVKCPSEHRAFHTINFIDNKFVITGGEDYSVETSSNLRTLIYSIDSKAFQYCEDVINLSGHQSWSAFGIIYHWGGIRHYYGKSYMEGYISLCNPIFYTDNQSIENIYFNFLQQSTLESLERESKNPAEESEKLGPEPTVEVQAPKDSISGDADNHGTSQTSETTQLQGRPRRSAAIKCLNAIELDNLRRIQMQEGVPPSEDNKDDNI